MCSYQERENWTPAQTPIQERFNKFDAKKAAEQVYVGSTFAVVAGVGTSLANLTPNPRASR